MSEDRGARAETFEGWFRLQLTLADAVVARTGAPLDEAVLALTNLHRRFGLGDAGAGPLAPVWTRFVEALKAAPTLEARVAVTKATFAASPPEPPGRPRFGCFTHDPPTDAGVVRIHFSNQDSDDGTGPLVLAKRDRRLAELAAMFAAIRRAHPDARSVMGASWLYHLDAYRRLFPPAYGDARRQPDRVRLNGTSSWGQLIDHRGQVKPDVEAAFLRNLRDNLDPARPWRVFPYPALVTSAPIEAFCAFYEAL